jgi:large subunit ribosomal protein L18
MSIAQEKRQTRKRRHRRVRKKVVGMPDRPRLSVFRSLRHIYAQIINDLTKSTMVHASSLDEEVRKNLSGQGRKRKEAEAVGKVLAKRAKAAGIQKVVFDRGGYQYHGRIKRLAEAARGEGLEF